MQVSIEAVRYSVLYCGCCTTEAMLCEDGFVISILKIVTGAVTNA